jgi:hypothetical protein
MDYEKLAKDMPKNVLEKGSFSIIISVLVIWPTIREDNNFFLYFYNIINGANSLLKARE